MTDALRMRHNSRQEYVTALTSAWRSNIQTFDPSVWLVRDPQAEEKMLRDANIKSNLEHRDRMVAGKQWALMPQPESGPLGDLAVQVGTACLGKLKRFTPARKLLARAFFHGQRFAKIISAPMTKTFGDGKPRTWILPIKLIDQDKRTYRQVSEDGGKAAHWEQWNLPEARWETLSQRQSISVIKHVYDDEQASLGYGSGLREALGWWWYAKENVFQESLQAIERFAQGMLVIKVDGLKDAATSLPNANLYQKHVDAWEDMRARHILVMDKDDEATMVEMSGTGSQMLTDFRKELVDTIAILILAANLPTNATEGGSFALASIQENSTESLMQYDRETLEETLSDDLLGFIWSENHRNLWELGLAEEMPRFNITQEKILDPEVRGRVILNATQIGLPVAEDEAYEQLGLRKPEEGEQVLVPPAPPAPGGLGGFGEPGGFGGFGK